MLDAVGVQRPAAFGGESLLPVVAGDGRRRARPLFASLYGQAWTVRQGDLKLVRTEDEDGAVREELYDLAKDPGETNNVASQQRDLVADLRHRWCVGRLESGQQDSFRVLRDGDEQTS